MRCALKTPVQHRTKYYLIALQQEKKSNDKSTERKGIVKKTIKIKKNLVEHRTQGKEDDDRGGGEYVSGNEKRERRLRSDETNQQRLKQNKKNKKKAGKNIQ